MDQNHKWIDSHCHLEMLKGNTQDALEKSFRQGMRICISIGTNHESNRKVQQYCGIYDQVFGTFGFHPHTASKFEWDHLYWIKREIEKDDKIVAIGECGFDFFYSYSKKDEQKEAFAAQLSLASELGIPVVIHSRDADQETRDMLDSFKGKNLTGVIHCFTSTLELAKYVLDAGFYLSFNGICTFPQADSVRRVLKYTPRDRILLETDAPYLSPVPYRGKPNIPGHVSIIGEYIADFLKMPIERFSELVFQNTITLFPRISYEY
ncbi:MAG: TatD family hydrolase [Proteobacteria bacterium]|nr:TatD family hydrolase [Pseudomonadota bacterium]